MRAFTFGVLLRVAWCVRLAACGVWPRSGKMATTSPSRPPHRDAHAQWRQLPNAERRTPIGDRRGSRRRLSAVVGGSAQFARRRRSQRVPLPCPAFSLFRFRLLCNRVRCRDDGGLVSMMSTKKRKSTKYINPKSKRVKLLRATETPQQREVRLELLRIRKAESRAAETTAQRQARLEQQRIRQAESRAAETTEQRQARLEKQQIRQADSRAVETIEQREVRLQQQRIRQAEARAAETLEQRQIRLEQQQIRQADSRAVETTGQREARLQQQRIRQAESRVAETIEQHQTRLEKQQANSRTTKTIEQHQVQISQQQIRQCELRLHKQLSSFLKSAVCSISNQSDSPNLDSYILN
ncbi:uncharacterized protein LOC143917475 isoform X1 [Arctopsyche grandis]|uniref:uncharacterized protein LOC143917475 isoform X1 n=2 Tax=Arctopsyche grandis TaxID=121162 RepID=UPI00406D9366